jgi:AcrR family transcriptional regulator
MAKDAQATRRRILDAAYELFYRKGFGRVGVDDVAAAAGITKRTLYYHFLSKDDLLAAVLDLHSELALARIRKYEDRYSGSAGEILDILFAELSRWSAKPSWTGAGFTRLAMELADLPGHPARAIATATRPPWKAGWPACSKGRALRAPPSGRARWCSCWKEPRR